MLNGIGWAVLNNAGHSSMSSAPSGGVSYETFVGILIFVGITITIVGVITWLIKKYK